MPGQAEQKRPRKMNRWLRFLWISILAGSIPAVLEALFGHFRWQQVLTQTLYGFVYAACIGAICTAILPRIAAPVLRLRPALKWVSLVSSIVAMAAAGCLAALCILVLLGATSRESFAHEYWQSLKLSTLITLVFGLSAFFHEVVMARLNKATLELKARDEAAEKLRQAATEARLSSLESRVQPHFLFNTLNSVLALIRENPAAAEKMVERLAALLRFSLDANQSRTVPLSLEAKIIRDYLEIEQARFGSRLRYSIHIPDSLANLQVPPMSLQTVVENSVKYAVSVRREGAAIALTAKLAGGKVRIEVADDGPGFSSVDLKPGHGLELLEGRVEGLYQGAGSLEISSVPGGGASVTLVIPTPAASELVPERQRPLSEVAL